VTISWRLTSTKATTVAEGVYLPTASSDKEPTPVNKDTPEEESNIKSSPLATKIRQNLATTGVTTVFHGGVMVLVPDVDFHC
jgi:hypothetical protein